jgi:hypothetical protein
LPEHKVQRPAETRSALSPCLQRPNIRAGRERSHGQNQRRLRGWPRRLDVLSRLLSSRFDLKKSSSYGVGTRPDASPNSIGALPCLDSVRFSPITESGSPCRRVSSTGSRRPDRRALADRRALLRLEMSRPGCASSLRGEQFQRDLSAQALISRARNTGTHPATPRLADASPRWLWRTRLRNAPRWSVCGSLHCWTGMMTHCPRDWRYWQSRKTGFTRCWYWPRSTSATTGGTKRQGFRKRRYNLPGHGSAKHWYGTTSAVVSLTKPGTGTPQPSSNGPATSTGQQAARNYPESHAKP